MYKRIRNLQAIKRLRDGAIIPADPDNRDYQEYLEWQMEGNTPEPPDPEPPPTQDEIDAESARNNPAVKAFMAMTPDQIDTWIQNNVVDFQSAKSVVRVLAVALKGVIAFLRRG